MFFFPSVTGGDEGRILDKVYQWVRAKKKNYDPRKQFDNVFDFHKHFKAELENERLRGILMVMLKRCCMDTNATVELCNSLSGIPSRAEPVAHAPPPTDFETRLAESRAQHPRRPGGPRAEAELRPGLAGERALSRSNSVRSDAGLGASADCTPGESDDETYCLSPANTPKRHAAGRSHEFEDADRARSQQEPAAGRPYEYETRDSFSADHCIPFDQYNDPMKLLHEWLHSFQGTPSGPADKNWKRFISRFGMLSNALLASMGGTYLKDAGEMFAQGAMVIKALPEGSAESIAGILAGSMGYIWLFTLFGTAEPKMIKSENHAWAIIATGLSMLVGIAVSFPSGIVSGKGFNDNFYDITGARAPEWMSEYLLPEGTNILANGLMGAMVIGIMVSAIKFLASATAGQSGASKLWMLFQIIFLLSTSALSNLAYFQAGTEVPGVNLIESSPMRWFISALLNLTQVMLTMLPALLGSARITWSLHESSFSRAMMLFMGVCGGLFDGTMTVLTFNDMTDRRYPGTGLALGWVAAVSAGYGFFQYGPGIADSLRQYWTSLRWGTGKIVCAPFNLCYAVGTGARDRIRYYLSRSYWVMPAVRRMVQNGFDATGGGGRVSSTEINEGTALLAMSDRSHLLEAGEGGGAYEQVNYHHNPDLD
jgi:hypothetical protein